jgi:hypothetical protein
MSRVIEHLHGSSPESLMIGDCGVSCLGSTSSEFSHGIALCYCCSCLQAQPLPEFWGNTNRAAGVKMPSVRALWFRLRKIVAHFAVMGPTSSLYALPRYNGHALRSPSDSLYSVCGKLICRIIKVAARPAHTKPPSYPATPG